MATKTWIGGGNDNASNGSDWSPAGAPQPGDTLIIQDGTMNIRGDDLAGDQLTVGEVGVSNTPTLDLSDNAYASVFVPAGTAPEVTVNVKGSDTLIVNTATLGGGSDGAFTINLGNHATLTAAFETTWFGSAFISGGPNSLVIAGDSTLNGDYVVIGPDVQGGNFVVETSQSVGGHLEFGGTVDGTSITVTGDPTRGTLYSHLKIDQPDAFQGKIALGVLGEVDLQGLLNATSYSLKGDMLSIYDGNKVIDRLHLTLPANPLPALGTFDLTVAQTAAGVVLDRGAFTGTGTVLPIHTTTT